MKHNPRLARAEAALAATGATDTAAPCPGCGLPRNRTVFTSSQGTTAAAFRADCPTCAATRVHVRFVRPIVRTARESAHMPQEAA